MPRARIPPWPVTCTLPPLEVMAPCCTTLPVTLLRITPSLLPAVEAPVPCTVTLPLPPALTGPTDMLTPLLRLLEPEPPPWPVTWTSPPLEVIGPITLTPSL